MIIEILCGIVFYNVITIQKESYAMLQWFTLYLLVANIVLWGTVLLSILIPKFGDWGDKKIWKSHKK